LGILNSINKSTLGQNPWKFWKISFNRFKMVLDECKYNSARSKSTGKILVD